MSTLRIAAETVRFLPPTRVTDSTGVLTLKNLVLEPLLRWEAGRVRPGLFGRWRHEDGGRRWVFAIRDGAAFHDGVACTSGHVLDFVAGILRSVDMFGMTWSYARYLRDARLSADGPGRVVVENPTPFADVLDVFTEFFPCREDAAGRPWLGTGPYRVVEAENERLATLERVRGEGPARIAVTAMPEAAARWEALWGKATDAAMHLEHLEGGPDFDPRFDWGRTVHAMSVMFYLDASRGVFASAAARMAANLAVDKRAIVDGEFHGLGEVSSTVVSPWHLGMRSAGVAPIPYDPEAARRLLDGVGGGGPVVLRTPLVMPERAREVSGRVAEDLRAVGLDVRIEVQPDRPEYAREVGRKEMGDLAIFDSTPHSTFRVLDDKVSSLSRGVWWQGYEDAAFEALFAAARGEVEDEAREVAYGRCLARLRENPPWLYLFHPVMVFAARPGVGRLSLDPKGVLNVG